MAAGTVTLETRLDELDLTRWIRSGDTVMWSQGTSEPVALLGALVEQRHKLGRIRAFMGSSYCDAIRPEHADAIDFIGIGAVGRTRAFLEAGALGIIPCHLTELARLIDSGRLRIDVVFLQVAENDAGELSYGAINSYLTNAVAQARVVIAEINDRAPWTHSVQPLRREQVHVVVRSSRPLESLPSRPPNPHQARIAQLAAGLIEDGDVLQVGIGSLPDALLAALHDRRDLGIHSGIVSDGVVDLIERGVVTNARKPIDKGVTVAGGIFGTQRLYDYAHLNPALRVDPVDYTHGHDVLQHFEAFVTVNAAIEVDLTGQVNGEVADGHYLGTIGGLTDFSRAAASAARGRSIVVLPSRTGSARVPRIVARLADGVVTGARADADIVVTENGVARLRGCTIEERVQRMIAIAHPDDREALERAAAALPGRLRPRA